MLINELGHMTGGMHEKVRAHLLSQSFSLSLRVRHPHQVSEGQVIHAMAGRAHLLVHLVPAANAAEEENKKMKHRPPEMSLQPRINNVLLHLCVH